MGRPQKDSKERQDFKVTVRFNKADADELIELSKKNNDTLADTLRKGVKELMKQNKNNGQCLFAIRFSRNAF